MTTPGREIPVDASILMVAVPKGHDPSKPLPLRIRRDAKAPNCWATGDGKRVFKKREWAEKAMELYSEEHLARSRRRMVSRRLVNATPVTTDSWVYSDEFEGHQDGYFSDVQALIEHCNDDGVSVPAHCFATEEQPFDFNIMDALSNYLNDEHHEDAADQIEGIGELEAFWRAWSAKQTLRSYYVDYSKVVVLDQERFAKTLAWAKSFLSEESPTP